MKEPDRNNAQVSLVFQQAVENFNFLGYRLLCTRKRALRFEFARKQHA